MIPSPRGCHWRRFHRGDLFFSGGTRYGKITFRPRLEMDLTTTIESEKKSEGNDFFFQSCQLVNKEVGPRCSIYRGETEIGLVYDNKCSGELESYFAFWREITIFSILVIVKMREARCNKLYLIEAGKQIVKPQYQKD